MRFYPEFNPDVHLPVRTFPHSITTRLLPYTKISSQIERKFQKERTSVKKKKKTKQQYRQKKKEECGEGERQIRRERGSVCEREDERMRWRKKEGTERDKGRE